MAISNTRFALLNGTTNGWVAYVGPYEANGHLYAPLLNTSTAKIEMYKWTNGTGTPAVVDGANSLTHTNAAHSYGSARPPSGASSHLVHVVYRTATNTLRIRRFNLTTETWESADVPSGTSATTIAHTDFSVTLGVRTDGDILLYFRGSVSNDTTNERWEGTTWSAPTTVFATQTSYPLGTLITGNSDQAFTYIYVMTNNDAVLEPLNNASTRGTQSIFDSTLTQTYAAFPAYVLDGATHRAAIALRDSNGSLLFQHWSTITNTPGAGTAVTAVSPTSTTDPGIMGTCVVAYNNQWHLIWSGDARGEIHMDISDDYASPTFSTDTNVVTGLSNTDPGVSAAAAATGIPVLYTNHSATPSVELIWAVGAPASGDATGTATAQAIPVSGGTATGTAGSGDTGTATNGAITVTGGTASGTGGSAGSADWTHVGTGALEDTSSAIDRSPIVPTIEAGDFLVCVMTFRDQIDITTLPSGWTRWPNFPINSTTDSRVDVFYKVADGSESGTSPVWSAASNLTTQSRIAAFRSSTGVHASPVDFNGVDRSFDATSGDLGTITPVNNDTLVIGVVGCDEEAAGTNRYTWPAGWTEIADDTGTSDVWLGIAWREQDTAGGFAGGTLTAEADDAHAVGVLGVRAVAGGGGTDATGTATAQAIPVTGATATGTAGSGATGTVTAQAVPVTGATATGSAGTTGIASAQSVPVTGATATGTGGQADAGSATAHAVTVTGATATGTAGQSATGSATDHAIPVSGATASATTGQGATGSATNGAIAVSGGTSTGAAGTTGVATAQAVPVTGGTATGTAGQSATGDATAHAIPITGGTASGSAGTSVDATGTATVHNIPVTGATATGTAGQGATGSATAGVVDITGATATGTAGQSATGAATGHQIPVTGGIADGVGEANGDATGTASAQAIPVTGGTATGSAGATGAATGQSIPVTGGSVTGSAGATGTATGHQVDIIGGTATATGGVSATGTATAQAIPVTGGTATGTAQADATGIATAHAIPVTGYTATADAVTFEGPLQADFEYVEAMTADLSCADAMTATFTYAVLTADLSNSDDLLFATLSYAAGLTATFTYED
jgi:hypothetical protein